MIMADAGACNVHHKKRRDWMRQRLKREKIKPVENFRLDFN